MHTHETPRRVLALIVATAALLAACGSDDDSNSGTSEPAASDSPPDETAAAPDETAAAPAGIDRTGETIKVGYVNNEGGVVSLPEFRIGGEVAIDAINAAGGVNGAMIETVLCTNDGSPEGSIDCANQMIEADVVIAYTGFDYASDAAVPLYVEAGIPYISSNGGGSNSVQANSEGSFILHTAADAYIVGPYALAQDLGLTKVAQFYELIPSNVDLQETGYEPIAANMGIELQAIGVDPAAPDFTAAVATAQAGGAEMIMGSLSEPSCIGMVSAARAAEFEGEVFAGSCSAYIASLGPDAIGTYNQGDLYLANTASYAPPEIQTRLADYEGHMTAAGQEQYIDSLFAHAPYSAWWEISLILETIEGDITADSVIEAFSAGNTSPGWLGPDLHCGAAPWPTASSNCSAQIALWRVEELDDGTVGNVLAKDFFDAFSLSGLG